MVPKQYKGVYGILTETLEEACLIKAHVSDYLEFLEELSAYVEVSIDAAREDLKRLESDDG